MVMDNGYEVLPVLQCLGLGIAFISILFYIVFDFLVSVLFYMST